VLCHAPALAGSAARIGRTAVTSMPVHSAREGKQQRQAHSKTRHEAVQCTRAPCWQRFCAHQSSTSALHSYLRAPHSCALGSHVKELRPCSNGTAAPQCALQARARHSGGARQCAPKLRRERLAFP